VTRLDLHGHEISSRKEHNVSYRDEKQKLIADTYLVESYKTYNVMDIDDGGNTICSHCSIF